MVRDNRAHPAAATNTSVRIPVRGVSLSIDAAGKGGTPGTTLSFTLTLVNTGSDPDSYDLSLTKPPTWDHIPGGATLTGRRYSRLFLSSRSASAKRDPTPTRS